ncbi:hypothetical protein [Wolbachia endosymbiont (group A) of Sphecodes monilicornis]|uniref:hypothetical protein n=1 Tax=Wolbachia endosymbiont (group A) of Sphecodes monilicornis TaxID=2954060 RepID=UPI0022274595|nr:hypothetical protein [Wolbachia endosymbiont (group A) of Sphecodes monilicornis]
MLLAFNLLIIIYPYPITSGLLWKELYFVVTSIVLLLLMAYLVFFSDVYPNIPNHHHMEIWFFAL